MNETDTYLVVACRFMSSTRLPLAPGIRLLAYRFPNTTLLDIAAEAMIEEGTRLATSYWDEYQSGDPDLIASLPLIAWGKVFEPPILALSVNNSEAETCVRNCIGGPKWQIAAIDLPHAARDMRRRLQI